MGNKTLYWHDYETFGTDPQRDRPAQFAGLRTDDTYNPIDEPLVIYLKPSDDNLPNPDACLITGITPQSVEKKGLSEAEFIGLIHNEIAKPDTCTLGYNSLRFDDEVTRNYLYRNFYDPYAREWQNGNSRWDLIDVVRAARALRPEGINWPVNSDGAPTIKLDQLTIANGIVHEAAHDALSDVYATLALAQLIETAQPKLFRFIQQHRFKHEALKLLQLDSYQPVVHISGRYSTVKHNMAVVVPIAKHPVNTNGVIVYDLSVDPQPLLELSPAAIRERIYTAADDLPEGSSRIPLKTVHINKCPVLAPVSVIRPMDEARLEFDLSNCHINLAKIKACFGLKEKIAEVFNENGQFDMPLDPDLSIYSGGFFSESDKQNLIRIRATPPAKLAKTRFHFRDSRLTEMLFRYRARNYPETLNADEIEKWRIFCLHRLSGRIPGAGITFDAFFNRLNELKNTENVDVKILLDLEKYGVERMRKLGYDQQIISKGGTA